MNSLNLEQFRDYLMAIQPLRVLVELSREFSLDIFIVGGVIRDFFLERLSHKECVEIDFAIEKETEKFVKVFARKVKGSFILLDENNQSFRIIIKSDITYQFDFTQFRGKDIKEDLALRDFTINALAVDLKELRSDKPLVLIDPYERLRDINAKIIRVLSERSFSDDPLRIIRAFAFSNDLRFEIEPDTLQLIKRHTHLLPAVAGERITEQLAKILMHPSACETIREMDDAGVLEGVFPLIKEMRGIEQGPYHHLDIWKHSLETLKELEGVLAQLCRHKLLGEKITQYLKEELGGEREKIFIVKLGVLFHDLGKPRAKEITSEGKVRFIGHEKIGADLVADIAERLKLSSREKNTLVRLVHLHLRPGYLVDTQDISPRAKLRFFRIAEEDSVALILVALADKRATRGPLTIPESQTVFTDYLIKVMEDYFYQKELVKPPRFLNGHEVMQILDISAGPLIGDILRELEEAVVEKKVNDRKESEEFIKALYKSRHISHGD